MTAISAFLLIAASATFLSYVILKKWRWIAIVSALLFSFIPVAGSNLWSWISGAVGELSIVTLVMLTAFIARNVSNWNLLEPVTRRHLYYLALTTGLLLYPATLGLSMFDPYTLGYGFVISAILLGLAVFYWVMKVRQVAVVLLLVLAAEVTGLLISVNTWDYLLDPLLWLFSPALLIIMVLARRRAITV